MITTRAGRFPAFNIEGTAIMDNSKIYEEQIKPLLDQVLEIARVNKIPFAALFQTKAAKDDSDRWECTINCVKNVADDTRPAFTHPHIALAAVLQDMPPEVAVALTKSLDPGFFDSLVQSSKQAEQVQH